MRIIRPSSSSITASVIGLERSSSASSLQAASHRSIHREDADPAKKGLADLIVAKHRNGPTDTVPLTFLPHLTQFRNHATAVT